VPLATLPERIDGTYYMDGGLLHVLPVGAAIELGATEIIGLNALPQFPMAALRPVVRRFQSFFPKVEVPGSVTLSVLTPREPLGSLREASFWKAENVERCYAQGAADAADALERGLLPGFRLQSGS
jgi:predicted acylesterase/phospholipase RssA